LINVIYLDKSKSDCSDEFTNRAQVTAEMISHRISKVMHSMCRTYSLLWNLMGKIIMFKITMEEHSTLFLMPESFFIEEELLRLVNISFIELKSS